MVVPTTDEATLEHALCRVRDPFLIVEREGAIALVEWDPAAWARPEGDRIAGFLPPCRPEHLGDASFRAEHRLRFAYLSGAMANGIGSVEIVEAMGRAGMLGIFGAAGLPLVRVEAAIDRLGRSLGVPTRVTYGLHLFPKNLPCHCKLEAYLPPYGWVSFDVSETQRLVKRIADDKELPADEKAKLTKAAGERMRQGFRDNTWLLLTGGTEYELAPKASGKVPLVSTLYAEADGKPFPTPDPADPTKSEFSWMTAHKYTADRPTVYPFKEWKTLAK